MKLLILATLAALTLAGCNTIEGVGHDISGGARRVGTWF
ncbi:entericidin EcnA/B family protein [Falsigemmobacter intermedius]|uniref:Entericidin EcnA/B family protein n=1 Tax=Falsigemmobacter intermedius TaxID=1553448 RepID=A0A444M9N1_9RHOB|nr:entericidin EcnA/B family protein [Falsigemmobacter intermedius]RWY39644.1 entericidin EcnA/B family protein [Falsigemmobacter intermedius]